MTPTMAPKRTIRLARPAGWALAVFIVGLWNDWVLALWLNPKVSMRYSLISELSARSQPYHWVFQRCDMAAGLVVVVLLPFLARWLRKHLFKYAKRIVLLVALVGLGSIIDASMPISCAASVQGAICAVQAHAPLISDHLLESTVSVVALLLASILVWRAARSRDMLLARTSLAMVVLQGVVVLSVLVMLVVHVPWYGIPHRAYELGIGLWLAVLLCSPLRGHAARTGPSISAGSTPLLAGKSTPARTLR